MEHARIGAGKLQSNAQGKAGYCLSFVSLASLIHRVEMTLLNGYMNAH